MLTALSVQAVSGLFASNTVDEFGPLSSRVSAATARLMTDIHDLGKNVLMLLIVAHIIGVAYHHRTMHDDLIGPMISGHKTLPSDPGLQFASSSRALALAALSAAIVWGVVAWL
jgi:cytochrome b